MIVETLIIALIVAIVLWIASQIPLPYPFQQILYVVIGLVLVIWLLGKVGLRLP